MWILLLLILAILLFGGLGIFVAKIFFLALVVAIVLSLISGTSILRRR